MSFSRTLSKKLFYFLTRNNRDMSPKETRASFAARPDLLAIFWTPQSVAVPSASKKVDLTSWRRENSLHTHIIMNHTYINIICIYIYTHTVYTV